MIYKVIYRIITTETFRVIQEAVGQEAAGAAIKTLHERGLISPTPIEHKNEFSIVSIVEKELT